MIGDPLGVAGVAPQPDDSEEGDEWSDATRAPKAGLRLAISDTAMMITPESNAFRTR